MYLPKSKYSAPKHTPGGEFSLQGVEYVGWYIQTFKNEYYTGKTFSKDSKLLIKLVIESNVIDSNTNDPYTFASSIVSPTAREVGNGKWTRYFVKDPRNNKIIEVDKAKYNLFKRKPYLILTTMEWITKGPASNLQINGYTYFGAEHQNRTTALRLEEVMPGISSFIKDYSQFVE